MNKPIVSSDVLGYDLSDPESLYGRVLRVKASLVRRSRNDPRTYRTEAQVSSKATSMQSETGQTNPVPVEIIQGDPTYHFEACDGNTRLISAGKGDIDIVVRRPFKDDEDRHLFALVSNYNRSELMPMDLSDSLRRQVNAGRKQVELAKILGLTDMAVTNFLSLQRLHPDLQKRLHPALPRVQQISPDTGFLLAKVPINQQLEVARRADRKSPGRLTSDKVKQMIEEMGIKVEVRKREPQPSEKRRKVGRVLAALGQQFRHLEKSEQEHIKGHLDTLGDEERESLLIEINAASDKLDKLRRTLGFSGLDTRNQIIQSPQVALGDYNERELSRYRDPTLTKSFPLETFIILHQMSATRTV